MRRRDEDERIARDPESATIRQMPASAPFKRAGAPVKTSTTKAAPKKR